MLRKILLVGLGLSAHATAMALGLGEIRLESALNEPLVAEIPISVTSRDELRGFEARVALNDTFARYGLDRPIFLNSISFSVSNSASGEPVLLVRSSRPIAEPFVTFLLEATWDSGRLLREYTVLLDPPVFSDQAVAAPVNVAQSVTAQPSTTSGQIVPAPVAPAPRPAPPPVYRQPAITGQTYGPVQRNQNLWNISRSVQIDGVSINQMMIAIYRANPEAFMGNINLLKEGASLQIPDAGSVRNLLRSDANAVVVAHNADWRGGRVSGSQAASTSGGSSTSAAPAKPRLKLVAPDGSEAGAGSSDGSAALDATRELLADEQAENAELTSELDAVRAELEETKRLLNLRNSDLAELQQSLGQEPATELAVEELPSEATIDATEGGEVEGQVATDGEAETVAETGTDTAETEGSATTDPTTLLEPRQPVEPTQVETTPADTGSADDESLVSKIFGVLGNWMVWGALALLGLIATLVVIFRSRGEESAEPWDAIEADAEGDDLDLDASLDEVAQQTMAKDTTDIGAREVEYFEDTGTFKPIDFDTSDTSQVPAVGGDAQAPFEDTLAGETGVKLDQADTLSEADFHMAYGLYDQAAELVGKAAEKEPERVDLKMKLLEIFFVWGNKDEFRAAAADARDMLSGHAGEWDKIMIMGKQICPGDELFEGDASAGVVGDEGVDLQLDSAGADSGGLDFQTEDFSGEDVFANEAGEQPEEIVDLDLGDALFASDDAPTASGKDADSLDFSFDDQEAADDAPTASNTDVKEKIEEALAADSGEDTEEMDLDQLGIDLDFGDITSVSEGTSGEFAVHDVRAKEAASAGEDDFDELFDGLGEDDDEPSTMIDAEMIADEAPHDKLLDTSELKVEMEELLKADTSGLMDQDETSRGVETLTPDEELDTGSDGETGSFSAEIRSLANEELEIGEELAATSGSVDFGFDGDDEDTVLQEALVSPDAPVEEVQAPEDEDFDDVFAGSDDETVLASTLVADSNEMDLSDPFGDSSQDTSAMPILDESDITEATGESDAETFHGVFDVPPEADKADEVDEFSEDIFPTPDGRTQEVQAMDLDVGDTVDDSGDNTTMRVATSNLALPENADLAINEVGTKLDLARAYLDMGDPDGARGILEEVMQEGNDNQQADARALLEGLS